VPYSRLATPSATIAALRQYDLYTRKSLGQHFLVDDNIVGRIIASAAIEPGEVVLEVGPGMGTLTWALLGTGARVVAVEFDERLLVPLRDIAASHDALSVVHADAVVVPVDQLTVRGEPQALVANLPYSVAATVILRFFEEMPSLKRAVVMVQAEVADRIAATPGTKAYGAYTVKLGLHARVIGSFAVSRSCFLPPPHVDSAVVQLERIVLPENSDIIAGAMRMADAAFSQRLKTLRNSLVAGLGVPASEAERILGAAGIDSSLRAERLTVEEFVRLGEAARNARR